MFKIHLISLAFIWFVFLLSCISFFYPSSTAQDAYQSLMHDQRKKGLQQEDVFPIQQVHLQVSKQIFYQKGAQRLQVRLMSERSNLVYLKREGELLEHFQELTCLMQEDMNPEPLSMGPQAHASMAKEGSSQRVMHRFKANKAIYSYQRGQLDAEEVDMARYLLPEHFWPASLEMPSPFFQGYALHLHFSLFKEPILKVQGFQAILPDGRNEW